LKVTTTKQSTRIIINTLVPDCSWKYSETFVRTGLIAIYDFFSEEDNMENRFTMNDRTLQLYCLRDTECIRNNNST
jgi:hypothetical protein